MQPHEIERQIELTRAEQGYDVDVLANRMSPSWLVQREVSTVKNSVVGVRERITGSAESAVSNFREGTTGSVGRVQQKAQGNPLAAGLITFGIGWLTASLLPVTEKEQEVAGQIEQPIREAPGAVGSQLKESAQGIGESLREPTPEAVETVNERASQSVTGVKDEASSSASDVADQARGRT